MNIEHPIILRVENLTKIYRIGLFSKKSVTALNNVSFKVKRGEVFGIMGESGAGKTTLVKILLRLISPDHGKIFFDNKYNLLELHGKKLRKFRQKIQAISQNYESALNPRMKVDEILKEVFLVRKETFSQKTTKERLIEMLMEVGLDKELLERYPAQLSAGQLQRINITRAMFLKPELLIADEPTSNLDVSVQAQIIHLMLKLKKKTNSTLIFISHDVDMLSLICDRVAVIKDGEITEIGSAERIFRR